MKGLIIKDLMCLRKMRATFIFVTVSSFVITVMVLISARYGNIALAEQEYLTGGTDMPMSPVHLLWYAVAVMVLLPLASWPRPLRPTMPWQSRHRRSLNN